MSKFQTILRAGASFILLLSASLTQTFAQSHPNLERGLGGESNQADTFDNVNLFNGNLSLVIPIGQTFNAGGTFNYRLTLVYNSNVWDFKQAVDSTQPASGGIVNQSIPDPKTNAGLGWHLSLGALYKNGVPDFNDAARWLYVAPDGSEHAFWDTLHQGDAPDGKMYTRDGSYLRLTVLDCPVAPLQCHNSRGTVEFPDGQVHTFDAAGRLERMHDRFNNSVNVTYPAGRIVLTDTFNRQITIWLTAKQQVDKVDLPAFNSTTPASYDFTYTTKNIARHNKDNFNWALNGKPERVNVDVLDSVTLPAGAGSYNFTYETDYGTGGVPGVIRSARVPTLGRYEWDFTLYRFPVNDPTEDPPAQEPSFLARISTSDGVSVKRVFAAGATTTADQWVYTQRVSRIGRKEDPRSATVTTVRSPVGDETVNHFNTTFGSWDYGLPYTLISTNADGTLFVSQEVYKGLATGGNKKRIEYVRYETDGGLAPGGSGETNINTRRSVERTLFLDDGNSFRTVSHSNFDGLGHYRQTTVSGNLIQNEKPRTTVTNYNSRGKPPAGSPWVLNTYNERTQSENGVTAKRVYCFETATNGFPVNGFLKQERILVGGAPGANDVVIQYSRSGNSLGAVSTEEYFGGDGGGLSTAPCAAFTGSQYRIDYTYASGSVQTKAYTDTAGTGTILKLIDRDIDSVTGLPLAERDAAGVEDKFEFDEMGRLRWVTPGNNLNNRAWTEVDYVTATSAESPARKIVRQRNEAGGKAGTIHTERITTFDSFGRITREEDLMANGVRGAVETQYNAMGWKLAVSEKMSGTPTAWTRYTNFDAFGRPGKIIPADGAGHAVDIVYGGISGVTRTARLGLSQTNGVVNEAPVNVSESRDAHGRLVRVVENSADPNNDIIAEYGYDVGNRLKTVKVIARNGTTQQSRTFSYDNRGFLTSAIHPENGTTFYSEYDSRGHARRQRVGAVGGTFDTRTVFDRAERVTQVKEAGGAQRLIKVLTYAAGSEAGTWGKGKLSSALRHNYHDRFGVDVTVTENYRYNGIGGKVSLRDTLVNTGDGQLKSFTQSWSYTNLGQVSSTNYPQCQALECTSTAGSTPLTISYAYSRGYLSIVGGFVNQTTYHPNGLINQMTYANGITMTQDIADNGMARPARIRTSGVIANAAGIGNFDTDVYGYDGAGNITRIGANFYVYDRFNRLVEGTQFSRENWRQSYAYDDFGNLIQINTTNPVGVTDSLAPLASLTTNRLQGKVNYDDAGNQTSNGANEYRYDSVNMVRQFQEVVNGVVNQDTVYAYTADDQRIWSYNVTANRSVWTLRDMDGKVLREYKAVGMSNNTVSWSAGPNYVYHGSRLVGTADPVNMNNHKFFITDHLGTPRLVVNQSKQAVESHHYLPFGLERPMAASNAGSLQFTGHERDTNGAGEGDDLDYMHARYYNMRVAKFLSVDPGNDHDLTKPQSWNKYAYVRNNPINMVDPDGKYLKIGSGGDRDYVKSLMIEAVMRPSARSALLRFAMDTKVTYTIAEGPIAQNPGKITFGETGGATIKYVNVPDAGEKIIKSTLMKSMISDHHKDPSGLTTFGHELYHAWGYRKGKTKDQLEKEDHVPNSETGAAAKYGQRLKDREQTDMTREQAEIFVNFLLGIKPGTPSQTQPYNRPTPP